MQRGRGRGGRGGRGGPPGAAGGPVARDDDGTVIAVKHDGPSPLYPEVELPDHPDITAKDTLLLLRRRDIVSHSRASPFFIEPSKKQKSGQIESGLEHYSEQSKKRPRRVRQPLASVMTLVPDYFPEELFSMQDKRQFQAQSKASRDAFWKSQGQKIDDGGSGVIRLDKLAQMELAAEEGDSRKKGAVVGEEEDAPIDDPAMMDDDEEEDMENDDYYQGQHFDDDEGYEEYDDGGGDDAIY